MSYQAIRKPIVAGTAVAFHALLIFHLLFSPVIIVKASQLGIINASFVAFALMLASSLFFGRAYCAWFCPGCGVQEFLSLWVKRKAKNTKALRLKYVVFGLWVSAILTGYSLHGFQTVDLAYGMSDITLERKLILTLGAVAIILPLTVVFGRFASCKYVCWQAPFMVIGTSIRDRLRLPGLRLEADASKCLHCQLCSTSCPMDLDVPANVKQGRMQHTECILCGNCVDRCKSGAVAFSLRNGPRE